ncbi:MAG: hypothetical protein AAGJ95_14000 [Cyanobacteria bacterium J06554_11]
MSRLELLQARAKELRDRIAEIEQDQQRAEAVLLTLREQLQSAIEDLAEERAKDGDKNGHAQKSGP